MFNPRQLRLVRITIPPSTIANKVVIDPFAAGGRMAVEIPNDAELAHVPRPAAPGAGKVLGTVRAAAAESEGITNLAGRSAGTIELQG